VTRALLVFSLLLLPPSLWSYNYDTLLLKAQASLFPKLLQLDRKIGQKLVDGKMRCLIAYEPADETVAFKIVELMRRAGGGSTPLEVIAMPYGAIDGQTRATAIYTLRSESQIARIGEIAMRHAIITFTYDLTDLKQRMLFSLMLEKDTVLYLNKSELEHYDIDFVDELYQIVRFIDE
jgi:hypothetical protein